MPMTFTARHCTVAGTMAGEYAFTMKDLRKVVPPKREILRGIYLSFFHGAKIGVLGANGAGKSSLLRIMAGVDKDFLGEAFPAAGLKIGYLSQEPQLDPAKDVRGNVEEGVAETRALLTRFEGGAAQLGGRAGARRAVPAAPLAPGHAAARRADQPPRRGIGRVARALPEGIPGDGRRDHARSLLPRQRRGLDPRARSRVRHPVGRQLLVLARAEARAARPGGKDRPLTPAHACPPARVGPDGAARPAGHKHETPR